MSGNIACNLKSTKWWSRSLTWRLVLAIFETLKSNHFTQLIPVLQDREHTKTLQSNLERPEVRPDLTFVTTDTGLRLLCLYLACHQPRGRQHGRNISLYCLWDFDHYGQTPLRQLCQRTTMAPGTSAAQLGSYFWKFWLFKLNLKWNQQHQIIYAAFSYTS